MIAALDCPVQSLPHNPTGLTRERSIRVLLLASRGSSMSRFNPSSSRSRLNVLPSCQGNLVLAVVIPFILCSAVRAAEVVQYNRDIRPILAENCFACHGPDSAARKADLRLDRRDAAIEAGAITPGDPTASELIARINSTNSKEVMPPPSLHKKLTTV